MLPTSPLKILAAKLRPPENFMPGVCLGIALGIGLLLTFNLLMGNTARHVQNQAVERGFAEWYIDQDRQIRWRWKGDKP